MAQEDLSPSAGGESQAEPPRRDPIAISDDELQRLESRIIRRIASRFATMPTGVQHDRDGQILSTQTAGRTGSAHDRTARFSAAGSLFDKDPHDKDPHDKDPGNFDRNNFDRNNFDRAG